MAPARTVAAACGERLIPCSMTLPGNGSMLVLGDAHITRAGRAAVRGGFFNAGQSLTSIERVYVEESAYQSFIIRLVEQAKNLRQDIGVPSGHVAGIVAVTSHHYLARIDDIVLDAVVRGGLRCDWGPPRRPRQLPVTVLRGVAEEMRCMHEAGSGPVYASRTSARQSNTLTRRPGAPPPASGPGTARVRDKSRRYWPARQWFTTT
jgi:acyl-CoA reductase-like NAD-dependent aldehyde dehydrogenase